MEGLILWNVQKVRDGKMGLCKPYHVKFPLAAHPKIKIIIFISQYVGNYSIDY